MSDRRTLLQYAYLDRVHEALEGVTLRDGEPLSPEEVTVTLINLARTLHNEIEYSRSLTRRISELERRLGVPGP